MMNILFVNLITVVVENNIYHRLECFIDDRITERKMSISKICIKNTCACFKNSFLYS